MKTRYDFIATILDASQRGTTEGQLKKLARLGDNRLEDYLKYCQQNGLLTRGCAVLITQKGVNYLEVYAKLMKRLKDSEQNWKQREEWLQQRLEEAIGPQKLNWKNAADQTRRILNKSKTERILELLLVMSQRGGT